MNKLDTTKFKLLNFAIDYLVGNKGEVYNTRIKKMVSNNAKVIDNKLTISITTNNNERINSPIAFLVMYSHKGFPKRGNYDVENINGDILDNSLSNLILVKTNSSCVYGPIYRRLTTTTKSVSKYDKGYVRNKTLPDVFVTNLITGDEIIVSSVSSAARLLDANYSTVSNSLFKKGIYKLKDFVVTRGPYVLSQ